MMPAVIGVGAAAAAAGTEGAAPASAPRLYPHEAQKRLPVVLTWPHWGQETAAAPGGAEGDGAGAGCDADLTAGAGAVGTGAGTGAAAAGAATAGTPCGGVLEEKGLAWAEPRGSSAPQPKQNL